MKGWADMDEFLCVTEEDLRREALGTIMVGQDSGLDGH